MAVAANVSRASVNSVAIWDPDCEFDEPGRACEDGVVGSNVEGVFVGQIRGGPQGVTGRRSISNTSGGSQVGKRAAINWAVGTALGSGAVLRAAFSRSERCAVRAEALARAVSEAGRELEEAGVETGHPAES